MQALAVDGGGEGVAGAGEDFCVGGLVAGALDEVTSTLDKLGVRGGLSFFFDESFKRERGRGSAGNDDSDDSGHGDLPVGCPRHYRPRLQGSRLRGSSGRLRRRSDRGGASRGWCS